MLANFLDMFHYQFMQHAFIGGTITAILAGIVGYFVIIRQLAFAAHALGHIGFAGASGALLVALSPMSGQFLLTLIAAISMGALSDKIAKSDMVIGIVLSFCLGLGSLFLHFYSGFAGQATIILFGNLLGISTSDLHFMAYSSLASLAVLALITNKLLFASIEPELAEAKGIPTQLLAIIFFSILAVAVTLTSQVVGVILIFTLLIGPPAIAVQRTKKIWTGLLASVVISIATVWLGISLSYVTDWPISFWISTIVFITYVINSVSITPSSEVHKEPT